MNPGTGHLLSPEEIRKQQDLLFGDYEHIPEELNDAARLELAGKGETYVGKQSTGSINTWAGKQREKRKKMRKAKKLYCV